MLFTKGNKVRIKHTGEEGRVIGQVDEETVLVALIQGGFEIPVALEDLIRSEEYRDTFSKVKAKFVPGKQESKAAEMERPNPEKQYLLLKGGAIELGFEAIYESDGTISKYRTYLLNSTNFDFLLALELRTKVMGVLKTLNDKIISQEAKEIGEMTADRLSDNPEIEIDLWRLTTEGTNAKQSQIVKIKPKQFFKSVRTAPLLGRRMHLYKVLEELDGKKKQNSSEEDLKSYTKRKASSRPKKEKYFQNYFVRNVEAYASFEHEIDLHAENLSGDSARMSAAEILRLQLNTFEDYINKAIRLGVERVFIIHGVGKGRLRDDIAKSLAKNASVASYKNEYHHKYGVGATEVLFA